MYRNFLKIIKENYTVVTNGYVFKGLSYIVRISF